MEQPKGTATAMTGPTQTGAIFSKSKMVSRIESCCLFLYPRPIAIILRVCSRARGSSRSHPGRTVPAMSSWAVQRDTNHSIMLAATGSSKVHYAICPTSPASLTINSVALPAVRSEAVPVSFVGPRLNTAGTSLP